MQHLLLLHKQESFFGSTQYIADQLNYYTKISYKLNWKKHELKSGFDFTYLDVNEEIKLNENLNNSLSYNREYDGYYFKN